MSLKEDRLEKLIKQKAVLDARIKKMKAVDIAKDRKATTKLKILLGAYMINLLKHSPAEEISKIQDKIKPFLTREKEREFAIARLELLKKEKSNSSNTKKSDQ